MPVFLADFTDELRCLAKPLVALGQVGQRRAGALLPRRRQKDERGPVRLEGIQQPRVAGLELIK